MVVFYKVVRGIGSGERVRIEVWGSGSPPTLFHIYKSLHEESVHNNYLMGLKFGTSWRVALTKKKFLMGIWIL